VGELERQSREGSLSEGLQTDEILIGIYVISCF